MTHGTTITPAKKSRAQYGAELFECSVGKPTWFSASIIAAEILHGVAEVVTSMDLISCVFSLTLWRPMREVSVESDQAVALVPGRTNWGPTGPNLADPAPIHFAVPEAAID